MRARLPPPLASVLAALVNGDRLGDLFEAVPDADPLIPLFAACEGARIDFECAEAIAATPPSSANQRDVSPGGCRARDEAPSSFSS